MNIGKIARDVASPDRELALLALTSVVQLPASALGDRVAVEHLVEQLGQAAGREDPDVVFLARKGLNHVRDLLRRGGGTVGPGASPSPGDRAALLALVAGGGEATDLANAVSRLTRVGTAADVAVVLPLLDHADGRVRSNAVEFLERHGEPSSLLERLVPMMGDDNNRVKGTVASVLGRLGHPRVVGYLRGLLSSDKVSVRESAAFAAASLKGREAEDLLLSALRDPFDGVRLRAVEGLGRQKDPRLLTALRPLLHDPSIEVCEAAERAIAFITMEEAEGFAEGRMDLAAPGVAPVAEAPSPVPSDPDGDSELCRVGARIFELHQAGGLLHDAVSRLCYECLSAREYLEAHRTRAVDVGAGDGGVLAAVGRHDVGNVAAAEREAIARLEAAVASCDERLGRLAVELYGAGELDVDDEALRRRLGALRDGGGR